MLVEQLTHKRGSAPCGGQNEDVGSLVCVMEGEGERGGQGYVGEDLITALVRALECLLAQWFQIFEAAVDSVACGCQAHRAQQA